ncbi:hypothetical protein EGK_05874 [Macaca mulatta]|uniref:Uncharacterized protein n=1 Tax=Macaca mulatta TaxID=9544 RepID=G7NBM4_MACMU|nr:hypothetical protein EGK_05874 [Macaca mulatta]
MQPPRREAETLGILVKPHPAGLVPGPRHRVPSTPSRFPFRAWTELAGTPAQGSGLPLSGHLHACPAPTRPSEKAIPPQSREAVAEMGRKWSGPTAEAPTPHATTRGAPGLLERGRVRVQPIKGFPRGKRQGEGSYFKQPASVVGRVHSATSERVNPARCDRRLGRDPSTLSTQEPGGARQSSRGWGLLKPDSLGPQRSRWKAEKENPSSEPLESKVRENK